ncbi:MAG: hypothetical protein JW888_01150, partial [Pirellulales bacterium]|nr:hypothetical protein [Pirellulales bacterium]
PEGTALVPRVHAVYDFRSNSLIVRASPRDMDEVAAILARLDTGHSESFNEVRVFKLKNASAEVLAPVLQDALTGQMYGQKAGTGLARGAMMGGTGNEYYERKSTRLQMITIDAQGRKIVNSGILTDAQVTADVRTNGLVVTASAESMPLIAALIRELDLAPSVEAQVKVFTLRNGDATNMATMLQNIFGTAVTGEELAVRTGVVEDDTSLVGLHFATDVRTNSIIVTGSAGALVVVEAVVTRLDGSDARERKTAVYRVKNFTATAVATAVNQYLDSKKESETETEGVLSAFEQIEREVIVVAEPTSNSLIVSATPRYYSDITALIEKLDRRPPMAAIQVVIAEVVLDNFDEFGIELGLEDSILFNRTLATGGLAIPGSIFSNGLDTGGQAVTSLGTGRVNSELSYGGLVLSASSESVSAMIRALSTCQRLKVLSRPQIMTLDNAPAQIMVGEDVPTIKAATLNESGQQNQIEYREVGLIVQVTPRITPDGLVVMEVVAINSKVGAIENGIPVTVADGQVIRAPRIEKISANAMVSAADGQTVVLGGLIVEEDELLIRRVPVISTVPVVGNLFKYEAKTKNRKELLIILTPRIVDSEEDAMRIGCVEASRIHWCRSDLERLDGGYGGNSVFGPGCSGNGPQVIYPDETPTIEMMPSPVKDPDGPEMVPTPEAAPMMPGVPEHGWEQGPGENQPQAIETAPPTDNLPPRSEWQPMSTAPAMPNRQSRVRPQVRDVANPRATSSANVQASYLVQPLPPVEAARGQRPDQGPGASPGLVRFAGEDRSPEFRPVRSATYYTDRN